MASHAKAEADTAPDPDEDDLDDLDGMRFSVSILLMKFKTY